MADVSAGQRAEHHHDAEERIHCDIKCKKTQSQYSLHQECGFSYLISGCRMRADMGWGEASAQLPHQIQAATAVLDSESEVRGKKRSENVLCFTAAA
eukprot:3666874-Rhodomonas_salina.1